MDDNKNSPTNENELKNLKHGFLHNQGSCIQSIPAKNILAGIAEALLILYERKNILLLRLLTVYLK